MGWWLEDPLAIMMYVLVNRLVASKFIQYR